MRHLMQSTDFSSELLWRQCKIICKPYQY